MTISITSSVPNNRNTALRTFSLQGLQKGNGRFRIPFVIRFEPKRLSREVKCPIVGLLLSLVAHWDFNPLTRLAPHIPTQVSLQQMAFVLEEDNQLSRDNLGGCVYLTMP